MGKAVPGKAATLLPGPDCAPVSVEKESQGTSDGPCTTPKVGPGS
jgi:hypothetical protein